MEHARDDQEEDDDGDGDGGGGGGDCFILKFLVQL
jgi:hypothetical protein